MTEKVTCPLFKKCGGCQLLNLTYQKTLQEKLDYVNTCLKKQKIHFQINKIIGSEKNVQYRNKMIIGFKKVNGKVIAGFYEENSHQIIDLEDCLMHSPLQNQIARGIKEIIISMRLQPYDEDKKTGVIRYAIIKEAVATGELLVVIVTATDTFVARSEFVKRVRALSNSIKTIIQNVNARKTSIVLGEKERILYGKGYIYDYLFGIRFPISSKSFYQVNPLQTIKLYQTVKDFANISKNDVILDAYSGVGTIGMILASEAKKVISVENNKQAVMIGINNAKENKIQNVHFICDDATHFIQNMASEQLKIDCLIMDPPRTGSTPSFLSSAIHLKPQKIVYVSCGPDTLARDLTILLKEYKIKKATLVDMFCWTKHVETVVCLEHK